MHDGNVASGSRALISSRLPLLRSFATDLLRQPARNLGLLAALGAWLGFLAIKAPFYFTSDNFLVVGLQMAFIGIATTGMTMLVISGNVDLSIGSMYAVAATAAALAAKETDPVLAILAGIAVGGAIGLINGILVWRVKISPIIVTLAGFTAYRGVATLMTTGYGVQDVPQTFQDFGQTKLLGVQTPIWCFAASVIVVWFVLAKRRVGRHIYAIGGNREASEAAGLRVRRIVIGLFLANGLIVGLAAVLSASRLGTANPSFGVGFEFDVITAVILGGVAFSGGEGSLVGVVLAILLIGNLGNGVIALGLDPAWTNVVKGGVLAVAVLLDQLSAEQRERFRKAVAMRERADA